MTGGFWAGRRPTLVAVGAAALLVTVVTALLLRSERGPDIVAVLGFPLAVAGTVAAVWGLRPRHPIPLVARELAGRVARERERAIRQALADAGDPRPADIGFRRPQSDTEPELVGWRDDQGGATGTLRQVAGYYQGLVRGRLVILGEPGAGKTVAATQLVLDLVRSLPASDPPPGERLTVPVLFSLPGWNPGEGAPTATGDELAATLDSWLAAQLVEVYGVPRAHAGRMVSDGWVLPVLDGLDEMDLRSEPDRPRATAAVRALNAKGRQPVVLVCRRADYASLAIIGDGTAGSAPILQDAQQIVLQDLTSEQVRGYLIHRFPDPDRPGAPQPRWQPVLDAFSADPAGSALPRLLGRPWQLFLAISAYHAPTTDPAALTRVPPSDLADHLLARLIPAVTARDRRPGRHRGHYRPTEVHTWLATLAGLLRDTSERRGWSPTDLYLDDLWPVAGWRVARYLSAALATVPMVALAATIIALARGSGISNAGSLLLISIGWAGAGAGIVLWWRLRPDPIALERLDLRKLRTPTGRRAAGLSLAVGLAVGIVAGPAFWLLSDRVAGLSVGLAAWLITWLLFGLAIGAVLGLESELGGIDQPSRLLRQGLTYDLALALAAGVVGLGSMLVLGLEFGLRFGLAVGPVAGLWAVVGMGLAYSRWPRYWIAVKLTARRGLLPRRTADFLDWAYGAGLLRLSGTATQFRHRELQEWLLTPADPRRQTIRSRPGSVGHPR